MLVTESNCSTLGVSVWGSRHDPDEELEDDMDLREQQLVRS